MDITGAILNLSTIRSVKKIIDSFNFSDGFLSGIDGFNLNPLNRFKDEFPSVIRALSFLDEQLFEPSNLSDTHEFVVHFENDVAEMDCATFLTINNEPFFVDIEVKDTDDIEQLQEQFEKREKDNLLQLNFDKNYLLIGFLNGAFKLGVFKSGTERISLNNINDLIAVTRGISDKSIDLRSILNNLEGIRKIQDIKNQIVDGKFNYYSATRDAISFVEDNIKNGKKLLIVFGNAGSGKTVAALSLFYKYKNTKLLIINKNLYGALSLYRHYEEGLCFFGTNSFISSLDNKSIAIIDECQRLHLDDLIKIMNKAKSVVLLGDNNQAFTSEDSLLNEEQIKDQLIKIGVVKEEDVAVKKMKRTARYNSKVNKLLEALHNHSPIIGFANEIRDKVGDEFNIDVTTSEKDFINKFDGAQGISRIYIPFGNNIPATLNLYNRTFTVASKDDSSFSISNYYSSFIGNTYHAISFDVDNSFVVLKNVGLIKFNNNFYLYEKSKEIDELNDDYLNKFNNQINVLFTRGRKSLHILTDDFYVYSYLNFKIRRGVK